MPFESSWTFIRVRMRERVRTSLWIAPGAAALGALAASRLLPALEDRVLHAREAWYLLTLQPNSARDLLSTIASSMMTFTGLVFSITILVLQLASSQFSPRVLGTFLEDRLTRTAMATFIGTFVYAMAVLPQVRDASSVGGERVPALSVFVAFALVLLSVAVFIRYIHGMAHSIRAVHVVCRVARDATESIAEMYPEIAEEPEAPVPRPEGPPRQVVHNGGRAGVLAAIDEDTLFDIAERADVVVALVPRLGDFVVRGAPLFEIWGGAPVDGEKLRDCVDLEEERTPHQDPAFAFRQLVDVAERALSPGINDPSTAVQAIDQLHDLLTALSNRRFPSEFRVDGSNRLRLILPRPSWDAFVRLAFDEIRQYGKGSIQVIRRLRAALLALREICPPHRRAILDLELREVDRVAVQQFTGADRSFALEASAQG